VTAVRIPDGELWVEEDGSGFPILMIQGLGYAAWAWRFQLPDLSRRWRTIAFDNRGTGRSMKPPGPYSIELLADDAAALLEALGIAQAHVLGMSMGGYVAQTLAVRRPELVRSLVLAATGPGAPTHEATPRSTLDVWLANADKSPEEYARATMWLSYSDDWWQANEELTEELLTARLEHPTPPECWRAQYDACVQFTQRGVPIEQIDVPTLVLHGEADRVVPVSNGRAIAERIPDARLVTLPGRGHVVPIEEPQRFNAEVVGFLERVERASS
jgi:pimeloyl-ACP methyl ester carboxylesterase